MYTDDLNPRKKDQIMSFISRDNCPECHNTELNYDEHHCELYCKKCGLVLDGPPGYTAYNKIEYPFKYKYIIKPQ